MKSKKRNKITMYLIIFLIIVLLSFFLSAYINLILTKQEISSHNFLPHIIIKDMIQNKIHLMVFFSMLLTSLMCVFLVMNMGNNENFTSELDEITDTIKTPKKIGQAQHGSARWLQKNEYDKTFCSYTIDPDKNEFIKGLAYKNGRSISGCFYLLSNGSE